MKKRRKKKNKRKRKIDHVEKLQTILHLPFLPFVGDGSVHMKGRERTKKREEEDRGEENGHNVKVVELCNVIEQ